jgi:hypothetical protein
MVEKHYAHLAPSYVAETIRRTAPDLDVAATSVVSLARSATGQPGIPLPTDQNPIKNISA